VGDEEKQYHSEMIIRISFGTYKIFWEAGSEDTFWRRRGEDDYQKLCERAKARHEERLKCRLL
jgi:paired amphipathic helix protein Sin3a